eukprot:5509874-Prymnesium_polylepis.1
MVRYAHTLELLAQPPTTAARCSLLSSVALSSKRRRRVLSSEVGRWKRLRSAFGAPGAAGERTLARGGGEPGPAGIV